MSELLQLVCDECAVMEKAPVYGWLALRPAKKSEVVSDPPANGDFCSVGCLTAYVARMSIQRSMAMVMRGASVALDELPAGGGDEDEPAAEPFA